MNILPKKNKIILLISLSSIILGFVSMKLEPAPHGYGPWALTVAPILVISGFVLGIISIFYDSGSNIGWQKQRLFIAIGWGTFLVSFLVYMLTLEETASLWDCAEFIACSYKLQVPHAPGAPLFLMIGRLFSLLAMGNEYQVAYWVNVTSAVSSAATVMFTFWVVVMFARKMSQATSDFSLIIAGLVGAFTIAFADSFWFSAVEAETYAMASLFLIIAFWAILKWEKVQGEPNKWKWLIFIFYVFGLSVGVHPMSLLVLPAIVIVIMFKYRRFSWTNLLLAIGLGAIGILFLNHVVLFGLPDVMKYFDIIFKNVLGMPFYFGAITIVMLLITSGVFLYRWSIKKQRKSVSIFLVGMLYFLIGYSSYFMILIRSQANPSIDEHNPENLMTLTSYLKRESYGGRPFLFGQYYTAKIESFKKGLPVYTKMQEDYEVTDYKTEYIYEKDQQTIFPRMYSNQDKHINTYREWTGLKAGEKPSFIDNMNFMFQYQFGHMYFRYLMFNFTGRTSDVQHADWLSPLEYFVEFPAYIENNKAHNNFLMLPFLLGIFGIIYQYRRDKVGFWAVMAFFLFLGLILVFYLNAPPNEPRERDYIYVGSYMAFAMWCGLGAMGIIQFFEKRFSAYPGIKYSGILILLIPILMLVVGFDDHNRSGRTLQVDHARNTLAGCAPNAILFTGGDNDTFPLWYVQEVEGFRTDVRVIVLSYFNGDWYIDQMQRKMYDSDPLPFSLKIDQYRQGGLNDILPYAENPKIKGAIHLKKYLELIRSQNPSLQVSMSGGTKYNSIPSRKFFMDVDQNQIIKSRLLPKQYYDAIPDKLQISWSGNFMEKSAFMVLDLIARNDWRRPIYFNITSLNSISLDLKKHVLQEGLLYRLLPIQLQKEGSIDLDKMYDNLMNKFKFGDLENMNVYYNHEDYQLRILQSTKSIYNTLASQLLQRGEKQQAEKVINYIYSHFVHEGINLDITSVSTAELLFKVERNEEGIALAESIFSQADDLLYFMQKRGEISPGDQQMQLFILRTLHDISVRFGYDDLAERCSSKFTKYVSRLNGR